MASLNKVQIIGNVGRDPEVRDTGSSKVANFSIATTERYNDKQGNRQEKTEWHNLVAWGKQAEVIEQYVKKGSSLYVEGKLETKTWDDNGTKKYKTEINVRNFQFLGGGKVEPKPAEAPDDGFGGAPGPEDDLPF